MVRLLGLSLQFMSSDDFLLGCFGLYWFLITFIINTIMFEAFQEDELQGAVGGRYFYSLAPIFCAALPTFTVHVALMMLFYQMIFFVNFAQMLIRKRRILVLGSMIHTTYRKSANLTSASNFKFQIIKRKKKNRQKLTGTVSLSGRYI